MAAQTAPEGREDDQRTIDIVADLIREMIRENQPFINIAMAIDRVYAAHGQALIQRVRQQIASLSYKVTGLDDGTLEFNEGVRQALAALDELERRSDTKR